MKRHTLAALAVLLIGFGSAIGASRLTDCGPLSISDNVITQSGTGGRTVSWVGRVYCGLGDGTCWYCVDMYIYNASQLYPWPATPQRYAAKCYDPARPYNTTAHNITIPSTYHGTYNCVVEIYPVNPADSSCNLAGNPIASYSHVVTFP